MRARSRRCCSRSALRILQITQERSGKIDAVDASPAAAALREEEVSLDRRFVEPIGYLDVHVARVREGFSARFGRDEGAPQNHRHVTIS